MHTSRQVFNVHNGSLSDDDHGLPPSASCTSYALHDAYNECDAAVNLIRPWLFDRG